MIAALLLKLQVIFLVAFSATEAFVPASFTTPNKNAAAPIPTTSNRRRDRHRLSALKLPEINLPSLTKSNKNNNRIAQQQQRRIVDEFVAAWNARDAAQLVNYLLDDDGGNITWDDYTARYQPLAGMEAVERELRLQFAVDSAAKLVVDDSVWGTTTTAAATAADGQTTMTPAVVAGLLVHLEDENSIVLPNSRRLMLLEINGSNNKIVRVEACQEPAWPSGEGGLRVLSVASKVIGDKKKQSNNSNDKEPQSAKSTAAMSSKLSSPSPSPPERYFAAWNVRDMEAAAAIFTDDAVYDDTAFPGLLEGKAAIRKHLKLCSGSVPASFSFCVDEVVGNAAVDQKLLVRWHVEQDGKLMPFSRGLSFYQLQGDKIRKGVDIVDGQPLKTAPLQRFGQSTIQYIRREPARLIPLATWVAYMYIVFFSNGILPGADALQLEQRTWEEVVNLSLNFFLVAPALGLPFSPVVHPMLEGVFNWLLSWAALFAGFLSDDRRDKPNGLPMLPTVIGMQFLTSAFLLPYLATRSTETRDTVVAKEELTAASRVTESRLLGPVLGVVGAYSMVWAVVGRTADFGTLPERWSSFLDLLSIDRVGSSFLVDLAIFAVFQAWLVDDDLKRRGVADGELPKLRSVGKYVPFFGMAAYMALRPQFPSSEDT